MKTLLCIAILSVLSLSAAFAQEKEQKELINASKKAKDRLFPEFAQDMARLKAAEKTSSAKPREALATTPQAVRELIFTNAPAPGAPRPATSRSAARTSTQPLPSDISSAEAIKAAKAAEASKPKVSVPQPDQGAETSTKPKN